MLNASTKLRVSQSTISKRISSLEREVGKKLIQRNGRNVILTPEGISLINQLNPLFNKIRSVLDSSYEQKPKIIKVGVSESILSSWGPQRIGSVAKKIKLKLMYHCHRSPMVQNKVESGEYDLGICAGQLIQSSSLHSFSLFKEEMVLVSTSIVNNKTAPVLCIEESSSTWGAIKKQLSCYNLHFQPALESFFSIAQICKSGFSNGLVPMGVAKSLKIRNQYISSLKPKLYRPIQVVFKKSKLEVKELKEFIDELRALDNYK